MSTLNFNHLYYFLTIAKEGSVTVASKKLFLTQPTLSGQLRQLEEFFERKLFDRKKKRLHLNQHGQLALDYAMRIFKLRDEMVAAVRQTQVRPVQKVAVGTLPTLSRAYIQEFLEILWHDREDVQVFVREGALSELIRDLQAGNLDVILSDAPASFSDARLGSDRIVSRDIVAAAHPDWKHLRKDFPQSLRNQPFMHVTRHSRLRDDIDLFFYSKKVSPQVKGEMDDAQLLRRAAETGRFFVILPRKVLSEALAAKTLITLGDVRSIKSDNWVITRKGGPMEDIVKRSITALQRGEQEKRGGALRSPRLRNRRKGRRETRPT
jgi:LysR family transcriptional activator of nhaA